MMERTAVRHRQIGKSTKGERLIRVHAGLRFIPVTTLGW